MEKLAKTETTDNDLEFKRQHGKHVHYGQVVQLRHAISNKSVYASSTDAATLDIMNMTVNLVQENAKRTLPPTPGVPCALQPTTLLSFFLPCRLLLQGDASLQGPQ